MEYLAAMLATEKAKSLRWVSDVGENLGWDIKYHCDVNLIGVKAKAIISSRFPSTELAANEWRAAQEKDSNYHLALVTEAYSTKQT